MTTPTNPRLSRIPTRWDDKYSGNAIDRARAQAPGVGVYVNYHTVFCAKCQKDKPTAGHTKRMGLYFCAECK
jgi:hypothetical protein